MHPGSNSAVQNTDLADQPDFRDTNDDNDDELTADEDDNGNGNWADDFTQGGSSVNIPDYLFRGDFDRDGILDENDLDSDNDGIVDTDEDGGTGFDPSGDEDGDGFFNYQDNNDATSGFPSFVDVNNDGSQ